MKSWCATKACAIQTERATENADSRHKAENHTDKEKTIEGAKGSAYNNSCIIFYFSFGRFPRTLQIIS